MLSLGIPEGRATQRGTVSSNAGCGAIFCGPSSPLVVIQVESLVPQHFPASSED
jgi:hypothetical protein